MDNSYSFWHCPRIKSIRNGNYEKHKITFAQAQDEWNEMVKIYSNQSNFELIESEIFEQFKNTLIRHCQIRHKKSGKLWYIMQITKR
jgi:hypothetical protein